MPKKKQAKLNGSVKMQEWVVKTIRPMFNVLLYDGSFHLNKALDKLITTDWSWTEVNRVHIPVLITKKANKLVVTNNTTRATYTISKVDLGFELHPDEIYSPGSVITEQQKTLRLSELWGQALLSARVALMDSETAQSLDTFNKTS